MEWMESLSDELKGNEGIKKFESIEALANGYLNIEARAGNSIRMAGPDSSAEDKAAIYQKVMKHMPELVLKPNPDSAEQTTEFYRMLGKPEDATGYITEGIELDDSILNELKTLALDTDMSKAQFKKYVTKMAEMQGFTNQQSEDTRTRHAAELKTVWGMAFEDRIAVVEKHLADFNLGNIAQFSPEQLIGFYDASRGLTGVKQAYNQPTPDAIMTPAEAKAQIKEIDNNPVFWSMEPNDRGEQTRMKTKRIELMRLAEPEKYA